LAKFTYVGKETRFITKLFKDTNIKIAFTTYNTIEKYLALKQEAPQNKYDRSGVYQLTCPNCKDRQADRLKSVSKSTYGTSNTKTTSQNSPNTS
jgi:hypothetical protein